MNIEGQAVQLRKQIEKLQWQIDNCMLTEDQVKVKQQKIDGLKAQIAEFEALACK